jgi:hypothetical protein
VFPATNIATGQTSCDYCVNDYYKVLNTCVSCVSPDTPICPDMTRASCVAGKPYQCPICTGYVPGAYCSAGNEPNIVCAGRDIVDSVCTPCQAGKEKKTNAVIWCTACETGFYKAALGTGNCVPCTKAPVAGGVYTSWLNGATTSDACPWFVPSLVCLYACILMYACNFLDSWHRTCKAGYYKTTGATPTCVRCNATIGKYSSTQGQTVCSTCTSAVGNNSYYQLPTTFDGASNNCPWY